MLTGLWTSWKATFDECINNEVKLREDYWRRSWEIYDRETRVVRELTNSKTIVELRTRLEKPYYSSSKHKDKSLEELLFDLKENQQKVTITEGNENYGKPLKQLQDQLRAFPRCWKLQEMFYEKVNETFKDEDLNDLRAIMSIKVRIDTFSLLLNPLRTVFDENLYTRKRYV